MTWWSAVVAERKWLRKLLRRLHRQAPLAVPRLRRDRRRSRPVPDGPGPGWDDAVRAYEDGR